LVKTNLHVSSGESHPSGARKVGDEHAHESAVLLSSSFGGPCRTRGERTKERSALDEPSRGKDRERTDVDGSRERNGRADLGKNGGGDWRKVRNRRSARERPKTGVFSSD